MQLHPVIADAIVDIEHKGMVTWRSDLASLVSGCWGSGLTDAAPLSTYVTDYNHGLLMVALVSSEHTLGSHEVSTWRRDQGRKPLDEC